MKTRNKGFLRRYFDWFDLLCFEKKCDFRSILEPAIQGERSTRTQTDCRIDEYDLVFFAYQLTRKWPRSVCTYLHVNQLVCRIVCELFQQHGIQHSRIVRATSCLSLLTSAFDLFASIKRAYNEIYTFLTQKCVTNTSFPNLRCVIRVPTEHEHTL